MIFKKIQLKKILTLFIFIFFLSCNQKARKNSEISFQSLDSLFVLSRNSKLDTISKMKYLKQIETILNNKKYDTILRNKYFELDEEYFLLNNYQNNLNLCQILEKRSALENDLEGLLRSKVSIGFYYLNCFKIDSAYLYFTKAEKLSLKIKDNPYLGSILNYKADILSFKKDFTGAQTLAIKAIIIAKKTKNNSLIYSCYLTLGNTLTGLNNFEAANYYYQKALKANEDLKEKSRYRICKSQILNYISKIYQKQNNFKKSIQYAKKGLSIDNYKKTYPTIYCYLTNTLAYSKLKLGDKSALKQFEETLKICDSLESIPIQITSKTYLGEFYLAEKDTAKANFYLNEAQNQAHKNAVFEDELEILQLLAKTNPKSEAIYSNRYIQLNDSLQMVERATRDKFARIEFETDEISTQKKIVETKNNQLTNSIWFLLAISVLVILLIVLLFKNYSQKARTRELLLKQDQQDNNEIIYDLMLSQQQKLEEGKNFEKQRISLELHDGVMGKLSAVRLNLFATFHKLGLVENEQLLLQIEEIQAVEKEIRSIAHDLNKNLFANNAKFVAVVQSLFDKIQKHATLDLKLQISDEVNWNLININIKINLYRIIQEALQNIEKHADAQNVLVLITKPMPDKINITISDDGKGFDIQQKKTGIGIKNMQKRAADLNGVIEISSQRQNGTKINLTLPI